MNDDQQKWYEKDIEIACNRLNMSRSIYNELKELGEKLNKLDCDNCNGDLSEEEYESEVQKVYKTIDGFTNLLGYTWYHQTDPRGASLYLNTEPMTQTNYTNGVCIY